ncbi:hypothetical protein ACIBPB_05675 [Micromonospora sp. NPDC049836]|uniref:hypothetical protein n=1 Tax=Micromonospora sp. NPDC049836 TaxID=3364274 RepID=UPI0037A3E246
MNGRSRVRSALRAWWRECWAILPHFAVTMSGWVPPTPPGGPVAGGPGGWAAPAGGPPPGWTPAAPDPAAPDRAGWDPVGPDPVGRDLTGQGSAAHDQAGRHASPAVPAPHRHPGGGGSAAHPDVRPAPPLSRRERRAWAALTGSLRLTSDEDNGRADPPVRH